MKKERLETHEQKQKKLASDFFEAVAKSLKEDLRDLKKIAPEKTSLTIDFNYLASSSPIDRFSGNYLEMSASIDGKEKLRAAANYINHGRNLKKLGGFKKLHKVCEKENICINYIKTDTHNIKFGSAYIDGIMDMLNLKMAAKTRSLEIDTTRPYLESENAGYWKPKFKRIQCVDFTALLKG